MTPASKPLSVLIVDADPYIGRVFEAKLTKEQQFQARSVTSGSDALSAALQDSFAVVLWDMRLRDTARLLPRLRSLCPDAAVLLLTTDDRPTIDADLARLEIADVLIKPLNLDTLLERVQAAVQRPPSRQSAFPLEMARVGQLLELASPAGLCVTPVLENRLDSFVVLGAPRVATPEDFAPGLRVQVQIPGEDALYSFPSRLLREETLPVVGWELQKPTAIRRQQRRKHRRTSLEMDITLEAAVVYSPAVVAVGEPAAPAEAPDPAQAVSNQALRGQTEDVGQGGCLLVSEASLPPGTQVTFTLHPSARPPIQGAGSVVRIQSVFRESPSRSDFRLAVRFSAFSPSSRRSLRSLLEPTLPR